MPLPTNRVPGGTVQSADINAIAAAVNALGLFPFPPIATGSHYSGFSMSGSNTSSLGAGSCRYVALPVGRGFTLGRVAVRVHTAVAGAVGHLGIYDTDADGTPGDLVLTASTSLDLSTTGDKEVQGLSHVLDPGLYWLAALQVGGASAVLLNAPVDSELACGMWMPHRQGALQRTAGFVESGLSALPATSGIDSNSWDDGSGSGPHWWRVQAA